MTFRHALYISVAAHVLAFGSAIAFARYGSGLQFFSHDVISVALVSPDSGAGAGNKGGPVPGREIARPPVHPLPARPAEEIKEEIRPDAEEAPSNNEAVPDIPVPGVRTGVQQGPDDGGKEAGTAASGQGSGQTASSGIGIVSPEEWAAIAAAIERTKNYPRIARERGIEGVVRLRFRLASSGTVEKIEIVQSSGYAVLDDASIRAVYRAAPMPYVNGWIDMPMRYVLK